MLREQLAVNCDKQAFRNGVAHYLLKPTCYLAATLVTYFFLNKDINTSADAEVATCLWSLDFRCSFGDYPRGSQSSFSRYLINLKECTASA